MADRPPYLEGFNLGLSVTIAIIVTGAGLLLVGPGRAQVANARSDLQGRIAALEAWALDQRRFRLPSEEERSSWATAWSDLTRRVSSVPNDPELVAQVSEALGAASVVGMQVERKELQTWEDPDEDAAVAVESPADGSRLELRSIPILVSFHSDFPRAMAILGRLEVHELPARIESLRMRRAYPGIEVALDLTYFVRQEGAP